MAKRGSKGNLPPRVPAARKIPKHGKFVEKELPDGTKRRVWEHQDFATAAVVKALKAGGWNPPVSKHVDAAGETIEACELPGEPGWRVLVRQADFDEIITEHDLSTNIGNVVADYISKAEYQIEPKKFRLGAELFHKAIIRLADKFPAPESPLAEALNGELEKLVDEKLDYEDVGNIEHCRIIVRALREASERVRADEAGAGKDADRAKHEFFRGLAKIYEERTGCRPKRFFDPSEAKPFGPFFEFITAVNKQIPSSLRLTDSYIDRLTVAYFPSN
jgi:hypothetical protein